MIIVNSFLTTMEVHQRNDLFKTLVKQRKKEISNILYLGHLTPSFCNTNQNLIVKEEKGHV